MYSTLDPVKREAGASPARSRRCKGRVLFEQQVDEELECCLQVTGNMSLKR